MAQNVTIYTTNTCAYCQAVKDFFKQKEVEYQEVNLDEDPQRRQELLDVTGQLAVPVTIVEQESGKKDVTVGFNLSQLSTALGV